MATVRSAFRRTGAAFRAPSTEDGTSLVDATAEHPVRAPVRAETSASAIKSQRGTRRPGDVGLWFGRPAGPRGRGSLPIAPPAIASVPLSPTVPLPDPAGRRETNRRREDRAQMKPGSRTGPGRLSLPANLGAKRAQAVPMQRRDSARRCASPAIGERRVGVATRPREAAFHPCDQPSVPDRPSADLALGVRRLCRCVMHERYAVRTTDAPAPGRPLPGLLG